MGLPHPHSYISTTSPQLPLQKTLSSMTTLNTLTSVTTTSGRNTRAVKSHSITYQLIPSWQMFWQRGYLGRSMISLDSKWACTTWIEEECCGCNHKCTAIGWTAWQMLIIGQKEDMIGPFSYLHTFSPFHISPILLGMIHLGQLFTEYLTPTFLPPKPQSSCS